MKNTRMRYRRWRKSKNIVPYHWHRKYSSSCRHRTQEHTINKRSHVSRRSIKQPEHTRWQSTSNNHVNNRSRSGPLSAAYRQLQEESHVRRADCNWRKWWSSFIFSAQEYLGSTFIISGVPFEVNFGSN